MPQTTSRLVSVAGAAAMLTPAAAVAQDADELARQLANPVANLYSLPFQLNYDEGYGADGGGYRYTLNIQPVIPISLNDDWNLVSRTIVPVISQTDVIPGSSQKGYGDIVQSLFFSPKAPTAGGLIWGVGPVFLLPTGSDEYSADQFGAGLTAVALKQTGPWTFGGLVNHIWDVGGGDDATEIDASFVQPFATYGFKGGWSLTLNTELTYDWTTEQASVPINLNLAKVTTIGGTPVSIGAGVRYWADSPENGPDGWGARLTMTFMYPK
ncbi:transporter [Salipiger bermudensis]|uniref:transporter n=1 Tax=Salipiger bermudensis TaxID=344736 RepID=UPI001C99E010|nr:transporter [Salipiger bermudensis]MBY6004990.1 transporter [Salipiger bermudensis]